MPLRALFLLATLKSAEEVSHTEGLCSVLISEFKRNNTESEMVRLARFRIPPGVTSNVGGDDEWPGILQKMLHADIVIFATPIWWGIHSSLMQRAVERLDELNDELIETGKSEFLNKVGGIVITGAEDGAQHVIGNLVNFMTWNGFSLPPAASLSYLGSYEDGEDTSHEALYKKFSGHTSTAAMARTMARNITHLSRILKDNPLPTQEARGQYLR